MNKLISVILPVYNGEKYLQEAIESILHQTYKNFEFIIINDGSTDNSLEKITAYEKEDSRIIVINRENQGLIATLNEGIEKSKGKYIARMDQDDISFPTRFEEQINFMEENADIGVCGTWVEVFGNKIKTSKWKLSGSDKRLKAELLFSSCFAHPSIMMKKDFIIESKLYYDNFFINAEDFELWTRLSDVTNFGNIEKVLLKYRILDNSMTRIADKDIDSRYKIISKIFYKYLIKLNINNTEKENILHFNLSVNTRIQDNNFSTQELKRYFDKLILANNYTKTFDSIELKKVFGKKWIWNFIYKKEIKSIFSKYLFYGIWSIINK